MPPISVILVDVISSGIENLYVVFSMFPIQTSPERSFKVFGVASVVGPKSTSPNLIVAVAAVLERGI